MKNFVLFVLILNSYLSLSQKKEVCFTIDDLPVVSYGQTEQFYLWDMTLNLISTLDKYEIPAVAFVNEGKMFDGEKLDSTQLDMLKLWFQNGYEVGNHTYSHMSYHGNSFEAFREEVLKGEKISRHLEQEYNKELRYFRHPYLRVGETKEKYDQLNKLLKSKGYITAPVTVVNQDWVFAGAYAAAEKKNAKDTMQMIGDAYVDFSIRCFKWEEGKSSAFFGRNIKHTLLLHANKLNADYLDDLTSKLIEMEYEFVTLEEALKDEAYKIEITEFSNNGTNWLDAFGKTLGKTYEATTSPPDFPKWISNYQ